MRWTTLRASEGPRWVTRDRAARAAPRSRRAARRPGARRRSSQPDPPGRGEWPQPSRYLRPTDAGLETGVDVKHGAPCAGKGPPSQGTGCPALDAAEPAWTMVGVWNCRPEVVDGEESDSTASGSYRREAPT